MKKQQVDYDQIAPEFDRRYASTKAGGRELALRSLVAKTGADQVLEVGCGTGHWLATLSSLACQTYGLDSSEGMLRQAQRRGLGLGLARGYARRLPFESGSFDLVFCVNAIHHFDAPRAFVLEAARILSVGGVLAVIGSDPHRRRNSWYLYDYFAGTYELDLQRFPSWQDVRRWMDEAGLCRIELGEVERIVDTKVGRAVLDDPYLRKNACSQLALLTESAYSAGVRRIRSALAAAEAAGETIMFTTELSVDMMAGYK